MNDRPADYTLTYNGELRTTMTHQKSGTTVLTDAPVDNHGKGESFSPTDLVSSALGSCVMTILAIKARDMDLEPSKMAANVWKTMGTNPRRIQRIEIDLTIHMPEATDQQKKILERTTKACPVARSLHPDTEEIVNFYWT